MCQHFFGTQRQKQLSSIWWGVKGSLWKANISHGKYVVTAAGYRYPAFSFPKISQDPSIFCDLLSTAIRGLLRLSGPLLPPNTTLSIPRKVKVVVVHFPLSFCIIYCVISFSFFQFHWCQRQCCSIRRCMMPPPFLLLLCPYRWTCLNLRHSLFWDQPSPKFDH